MKSTCLLVLLAILSVPLVAESPKGTVPRSAAANYAGHAEAAGAAIGASLLSSKQVHKTFTTDFTRCCLVVEVALYPAKDKSIDVWTDDFVLRVAGTETAFKPSAPDLIAAKLQKQNAASPVVGGVAEVNVGYESGIDPLTGQRVRGVYGGGGVGVGVGGPAAGPPASPVQDRDLTERELNEKALANDTESKPVAGYLYFFLPKADKKGAHQLEYTLNGQKVSLKVD